MTASFGAVAGVLALFAAELALFAAELALFASFAVVLAVDFTGAEAFAGVFALVFVDGTALTGGDFLATDFALAGVFADALALSFEGAAAFAFEAGAAFAFEGVAALAFTGATTLALAGAAALVFDETALTGVFTFVFALAAALAGALAAAVLVRAFGARSRLAAGCLAAAFAEALADTFFDSDAAGVFLVVATNVPLFSWGPRAVRRTVLPSGDRRRVTPAVHFAQDLRARGDRRRTQSLLNIWVTC